MAMSKNKNGNNSGWHTVKIPRSRIATFDVGAVAKERHTVSAMVEFDVTLLRERVKHLKAAGHNVSFTACLVKILAAALEKYPEIAAFRKGKRKIVVFNETAISIVVEKDTASGKVPLPLLIKRVNQKSVNELSSEIRAAKSGDSSGEEIVLHRSNHIGEKLYYKLPAFLRRMVWRWMLRNPQFAFRQMGNVVITSLGMMGKINGWFIHSTIHPLSVGIGSVIPKPVVLGKEIAIRDILNLTFLFDHNVSDGAPMLRFLNEYQQLIENAKFPEDE
jgi:pyruvate/2-oxoglutarate dehydrogenase complex dihydrolipoamide acyltransferase (E2) component